MAIMHQDMESMDIPYLKLNKVLLSMAGLWPYHSKHRRCACYLFFVISTMSAASAMTDGLMYHWSSDISIFCETVVYVAMMLGAITQCSILYIREYVIDFLYTKIADDWRATTNEDELEILRAFSTRGKKLSIYFMTSTISLYIMFLVFTYIPLIIDGSLTNYSKVFPYYSTEWLIDIRLRTLQIFLHAEFGIFCGGFIYVIIICMFTCSVQHVCAIYAITRYRLENLLNSSKSTSFISVMDDDEIVCNLYYIVEKHKEAIKGVQLIIRLFSRMFCLIEIGILVTLALFIFDVQYNKDHIILMIKNVFIALILVVHVFYINYAGEQIIQFSNDVHLATYYMNWHRGSVRIRKSLLMILNKTRKPDVLSAAIMVLSLENFASIIKISWSFATVLLTTQKKVKYNVS